VDAAELSYLSDQELLEKVQEGRWFVQPFSWHRVLDADRDGGGHIIRQARLFGNSDKTFFWRPENALGRDASGDIARQIERRGGHESALTNLHAGVAPIPGSKVLVSSPPIVVRRLMEELDSRQSGEFCGAQIAWELEGAVEEEIRLAAQYTEERWLGRFPNLPIKNKWVRQLNDGANWPSQMHGLVLADFARSGPDITRNFDQAMRRCDGSIPVIVSAVNRDPKPKVTAPHSVFFKIGNSMPRVSIQRQEEELELFLERAYSIAAAQAASALTEKGASCVT
jgi:hypothetical protein